MYPTERFRHSWAFAGLILLASFVMTAIPPSTQAQTSPDVDSLVIYSVPPGNFTTDDLYCAYNLLGTATTAGTTWYLDGSPLMAFYLPMEGGAANALNDYSGNGITATTNGDPTWNAAAGHDGFGAFEFDGNDDLDGGEFFPTSSSYTVTAWVYRTGSGSNGGNNILSGDANTGGHAFWAPDAYSNMLSAGHNGQWNTVQDNVALGLNTWYFVSLTFDYSIGKMVLYKNGAAVDSATVPSGDENVTDATISVGSFGASNGYMWMGTIDDPRIYKRALSGYQIWALYSEGQDVIRSAETDAGEDWQAHVTPFSSSEAGATESSNIITIQGTPEAPVITSTPVTEAYVGELYGYDVDATGFPAPTYSLTTSPAGMTINSISGLIEWTPAAAGSALVTVQATNTAGTDDQSFTIYVLEPPPCPISMSHYWKLDETGGSPYEDYFAGNDATCTNCPAPVTGIVGGAQDFDGLDDEVKAPNDGSWDWGKDDSFTIAYWMKTSASTSGNRVIVARDDAVNSLHMWVGCDDTGRERFQLKDINGNGVYIGNKGNVLNDGMWHFITAVRHNGTDMNRIYVDAVRVDSAYHDYTAGFSGTADLTIGYIELGGHYRFDGIIDEVATFDDALTEAEILAMYNDGLAGKGYCEEENVAPTIISTPVTEASVGVLYTYDVDAVGIPTPTYSLTAYPAGMTINSASGLIEWTPAAAGSAQVTVEASNDAGTDSQSFTILVTELPFCPDDMISYWKLDETGGTAYDDYYDGNDGDGSVSTPTPAAGIIGGAQDFNGTSDRITVDDDPSLDWAYNSSFTIELWAKFTNVASRNKVMIGRDDGGGGRPHWWVGAAQNTGLGLFVLFDTNNNGTYITGSTVLNDDQWHHIVAVKDESVDRIRFYVDGAKEDSASHDYTAGFEASTTLGIGYMAYAGNPDYFYDGLLDEIALYGRALSDVEIYQHFINGLSGLGYCADDPVSPLIVTAPVTDALVGQPYSYDVDATGIPVPHYRLVTSPAGMAIDSISGLIQWTPSTAGNFSVGVEAYNSAGLDSQNYSINIPAIPMITSTPVTEGTVGQPYTYDVDATGVPAPTYALLTYPAGMTINATSGLIEWTPSAAGDYGVTVEAQNTAGADSQSFDIHVEELGLCPNGISHYWKFDETSGPPYEDYYGMNDAVCSNCPAPDSGIVNAGQHFDGITDEVNVPNDGSWDWDKDASFTIAYWMKTTASTAGNRVIVARDDAGSSLHWWVGCDNSGKERFQLRDVNNNGVYIGNKGNILNDGFWHFIVAVRDNSVDMNRIYVDAVKVDSAYYDYTAGFGGTADLNIGYINLGGHYRFEGTVDEVATFDVALTDAEILYHYNNGLAGKGYCSLPPSAPTIVSTPGTDARVGQLYTYDVDATGNPAPTYALTTSPLGMTIDANTGLIEWTPAIEGSVQVTVEAGNIAGTDAQSFMIRIEAQPQCPEDLLSYWKLDETSGTDYADYYNGNHGQAAVSAPLPVPGLVDGAQYFNGTSDRITVDDDPSLDWAGDQSFTIELWAKFTNVASRNKVMIGRDGGGGGHPHWWVGAQQGTGLVIFNLLDTGANGVATYSTTAINDDEWHHIIAVRDNGADMNRLYIDGIKEDSAGYDYAAGFEAATTLGIGYMAYAGTPDYFYNGMLDEIALYMRALSDDEIQQHYEDGLTGKGYCTDEPVATLLQGFAARLDRSAIRVEWKLLEAGTDMRFYVSRASERTGRFEEIVSPAIERDGLYFVFTDADLELGMTYRYRVEVEDEEGRRALFETEAVSAPAKELTLFQNRPNPFNPGTTISFILPEKGNANLSIFDATGKLITTLVNQNMGEGLKEFRWDGKDYRGNTVSSGVYFYRLKAGNKILTKKMLLIK